MTSSTLFVVAIVVTSLLSITWGLTSQQITDLETRTKLSITTSGGYHTIQADGLPYHSTGSFPNSDNPNSIGTQSYALKVPETPTAASSDQCLPPGPIGLFISGVPAYNPFTAELYNAVEGPNKEEFDLCEGHPDASSAYHYHKIPGCITEAFAESTIIGVALDGYPIYSMLYNGANLTSSGLDDCHGQTVNGQYGYYVTADCPYLLGCFKGTLHSDYQAMQSSRMCQIVTKDNSECDVSDAADIPVMTSLLAAALLVGILVK